MQPTSGSCSSACAPSAARAASRATACSCRRRSRSRRPSRRCWPSTPRRSRRLASRASPSARARSCCARCRGCSAGATWGRCYGPSPASWWRRGPAPRPSGPPTRRSPPSPATAWCASDSGSARRKRRPSSRRWTASRCPPTARTAVPSPPSSPARSSRPCFEDEDRTKSTTHGEAERESTRAGRRGLGASEERSPRSGRAPDGPPGDLDHMRLVCIIGPTASGKSALALDLAESLGAEIVSADSRQIYRDLDVGTAKPTAAERARVRHHCLHPVVPDAAFDTARFRDAAHAAIADIARRGRVALVVGGTGLYVRALLRGLCPAPPRAPALRAALAAEDTHALHRRLGVLDPAAAARIAPTDARRIVRALEVALVSGVPLSRWQAKHRFAEPAYDALVIGLARPTAELDARIAARTRAMLEGGFLDEVRALRRRGLGAEAPGLSAVGYRELLACVEGRTDLATALAAVVRATRQFAKRQRTWFRREPAIVWHHPEREAGPIAAAIEAFLAGGAPAVRAPA